MHVWYVGKHRHNIISGEFGNVLGTFGGVLERLEAFGKRFLRFERFVGVCERLAG